MRDAAQIPMFDTHRAVKALARAGFDDAQAEAVVEQINGAFSENLATKQDLERLATKDELKELLKAYPTKDDLREALKAYATKEDLAKQNMTMLRYAVGIVVAVVALTKGLDALIG